MTMFSMLRLINCPHPAGAQHGFHMIAGAEIDPRGNRGRIQMFECCAVVERPHSVAALRAVLRTRGIGCLAMGTNHSVKLPSFRMARSRRIISYSLRGCKQNGWPTNLICDTRKSRAAGRGRRAAVRTV